MMVDMNAALRAQPCICLHFAAAPVDQAGIEQDVRVGPRLAVKDGHRRVHRGNTPPYRRGGDWHHQVGLRHHDPVGAGDMLGPRLIRGGGIYNGDSSIQTHHPAQHVIRADLGQHRRQFRNAGGFHQDPHQGFGCRRDHLAHGFGQVIARTAADATIAQKRQLRIRGG